MYLKWGQAGAGAPPLHPPPSYLAGAEFERPEVAGQVPQAVVAGLGEGRRRRRLHSRLYGPLVPFERLAAHESPVVPELGHGSREGQAPASASARTSTSASASVSASASASEEVVEAELIVVAPVPLVVLVQLEGETDPERDMGSCRGGAAVPPAAPPPRPVRLGGAIASLAPIRSGSGSGAATAPVLLPRLPLATEPREAAEDG